MHITSPTFSTCITHIPAQLTPHHFTITCPSDVSLHYSRPPILLHNTFSHMSPYHFTTPTSHGTSQLTSPTMSTSLHNTSQHISPYHLQLTSPTMSTSLHNTSQHISPYHNTYPHITSQPQCHHGHYHHTYCQPSPCLIKQQHQHNNNNNNNKKKR